MIKLKKIFLYFLPWLVEKFWQKITNGSGSITEALRWVWRILTHIPVSTYNIFVALNVKYKSTLSDDGPIFIKVWIAILVSLVIVFGCLIGGLCIVIASKGQYYPPISSAFKTAFGITILYHIILFFNIMYDIFTKEQEQLIEDLSNE